MSRDRRELMHRTAVAVATRKRGGAIGIQRLNCRTTVLVSAGIFRIRIVNGRVAFGIAAGIRIDTKFPS